MMTEAPVLILNRHYQAVNVTNVRRAMSLLYIGAARALDHQYNLFDFDTWAELSAELGSDSIATPSRCLRIPRVLVLQAYDRVPMGRIRFSRRNIYIRDDYTCQYCHRRFAPTDLNLDHVTPRSRGGKTNWENVVASCVKCNLRKANRTPKEAKMHLLKVPKRPRWSQLVRPPKLRAHYREWLPFLDQVDASYWNSELIAD